MKALILGGGLGTRLKHLTEEIPKPLLPIKGKPIMQYAIENLREQGITDIILGICHHADKIMDYFKDGSAFGVHIEYSVEKTPLGTGGAVKKASEHINEPFILLWADNLTDIDFYKMLDVHKRKKAQITMALTEREDVENFGVAVLDDYERIVSFEEKPKRKDASSNWINTGAFIIEPGVLDMLPEGKSSIERECFEKIIDQRNVYAHRHKGYWIPTDTKEKYELAEQEFQDDRNI